MASLLSRELGDDGLASSAGAGEGQQGAVGKKCGIWEILASPLFTLCVFSGLALNPSRLLLRLPSGPRLRVLPLQVPGNLQL